MNSAIVMSNYRVKRDARDAGFGLCQRPRAGAPYPKRWTM